MCLLEQFVRSEDGKRQRARVFVNDDAGTSAPIDRKWVSDMSDFQPVLRSLVGLWISYRLGRNIE